MKDTKTTLISGGYHQRLINKLSGPRKFCKPWQLLLFIGIINGPVLYAQSPKDTMPSMSFLNAGVFFSPSMEDSYFTPALDVEAGFWRTNKRNFFSWGASAEAWYFTSIKTDLNKTTFSNNTDGFINLNGMLFYDNKIITPYLAPTFSFVSDLKNFGAAGGIALGLSHKTGERLQTFIQTKYIRFSRKLDYLDMRFFMVGLSLKLSK
ncbi:MAG: hypothetical protein V4520_11595 [Bacteroidota bacterium]